MGLFFKKVSPPTSAPSMGQEVWGETVLATCLLTQLRV